jgi:hypothetical protein
MENGYNAKVHSASILRANFLGGGMALIVVVPLYILFQSTYTDASVLGFIPHVQSEIFSLKTMLALMVLFMVIVVFFTMDILIHEILHALGYKLFIKGKWKDIVYIGVAWHILTPYCWGKYPVKFMQSIVVVLLPLFVLGFCIYAVAMIIGSSLLCYIALINILFGSGDILYAAMVIKHRPQFVFDNPMADSNMSFTAINKIR